MTDDELRTALAKADPAPRSVRPLSRELLERTMTSDLMTETVPTASARRRSWLPAVAAAVVLAGAAGAYALTAGGDDPASELQLALPGGDGTSMMSCVPVQAEFLADMPVVLAGTVTGVIGDEVRLDVTRWYRGGDTDTVVLTNLSADMQALLGATDFRTGEDYLVSATDGTVNACGFTGPASAELQQVYDEAFPG